MALNKKTEAHQLALALMGGWRRGNKLSNGDVIGCQSWIAYPAINDCAEKVVVVAHPYVCDGDLVEAVCEKHIHLAGRRRGDAE